MNHRQSFRTLLRLSERKFWSIVFPKYCSQSRLHNSLTVELEWRSVNSQPWRFTPNSLSLPHAQSSSVCLCSWVYVVCVCFLLYLSVYLCLARCVCSVLWRGACLVCSIFISPFNFKTYYYMNVVVHIILCIWLYLFCHFIWTQS